MKFSKSVKKSIRKIYSLLFLIFLSATLLSCEKQDYTNTIFSDWVIIEESIAKDFRAAEHNDYSFSLSEESRKKIDRFLTEYKTFQSTTIYKNLVISETYGTIIRNLDDAVNQKDIATIRSAIFELEQLDKNTSQKSNTEYLILAETLLIFLTIISVFLFIFFRKYEKKRNELKQMGIYSNFMIKGIEAERSRISKEIHDSVLQDIKALSFKYDLIDSKNNEINKNLKNELILQTDECITKLRSICNNLTPVEFRNGDNISNGFLLAVQNLSSEFKQKTDTDCILRIQKDIDIHPLSLDKTINVFRVIQEALNNVEKHAHATKTSIVLTNTVNSENCKTLKVFITDNGCGFDSQTVMKDSQKSKGHFGLSNIKERSKDLGAALHIFSEEHQGTEIILEVPLQ